MVGVQILGSVIFCEPTDMKSKFQTNLHGTEVRTVAKSGEVLVARYKVSKVEELWNWDYP